MLKVIKYMQENLVFYSPKTLVYLISLFLSINLISLKVVLSICAPICLIFFVNKFELGLCFINCAKTIIRKKMYQKWSEKQKNDQLIKRSRYVEFNLLYDRGTKFGLNTGGNVEAILMSLPPIAKWK